ncbi:uncharacterized protein BDZ99DRAFT_525776 [Mytilinidion resinicola]|uniref:Uncharacterized protein n=1 Tax=Mytilinidion resinicola TaxID=574789 RepID=A0A6A6Y5V0_9PEZI|nr:uncharacterized protein BDZ99DRAFT_525776 [Mytilinidion resinicola]KAF2804186.1 hypothetical protein BDZ99DRAFT_525776 [Mytilinidion resinicola]
MKEEVLSKGGQQPIPNRLKERERLPGESQRSALRKDYLVPQVAAQGGADTLANATGDEGGERRQSEDSGRKTTEQRQPSDGSCPFRTSLIPTLEDILILWMRSTKTSSQIQTANLAFLCGSPGPKETTMMRMTRFEQSHVAIADDYARYDGE